MKNETGGRWRMLCEQAAAGQDQEKLIELAKEINRLLEEKEGRLERPHSCVEKCAGQASGELTTE